MTSSSIKSTLLSNRRIEEAISLSGSSSSSSSSSLTGSTKTILVKKEELNENKMISNNSNNQYKNHQHQQQHFPNGNQIQLQQQQQQHQQQHGFTPSASVSHIIPNKSNSSNDLNTVISEFINHNNHYNQQIHHKDLFCSHHKLSHKKRPQSQEAIIEECKNSLNELIKASKWSANTQTSIQNEEQVMDSMNLEQILPVDSASSSLILSDSSASSARSASDSPSSSSSSLSPVQPPQPDVETVPIRNNNNNNCNDNYDNLFESTDNQSKRCSNSSFFLKKSNTVINHTLSDITKSFSCNQNLNYYINNNNSCNNINLSSNKYQTFNNNNSFIDKQDKTDLNNNTNEINPQTITTINTNFISCAQVKFLNHKYLIRIVNKISRLANLMVSNFIFF